MRAMNGDERLWCTVRTIFCLTCMLGLLVVSVEGADQHEPPSRKVEPTSIDEAAASADSPSSSKAPISERPAFIPFVVFLAVLAVIVIWACYQWLSSSGDEFSFQKTDSCRLSAPGGERRSSFTGNIVVLICVLAGPILVISLGVAVVTSRLKEKHSLPIQSTPIAVQEDSPETYQRAKSLHQAAADGDVKQVEICLAGGDNINAVDDSGSTPLHLAVIRGRHNAVEFLVAKGADVGAKDRNDNTPLHWVARFGYASMASLFVTKGADIDAKNSTGVTPLFLAATHGRKDIVEFLLSNDADVNAQTFSGSTALSSAEREGHEEVGKLLRSHGARSGSERQADAGDTATQAISSTRARSLGDTSAAIHPRIRQARASLRDLESKDLLSTHVGLAAMKRVLDEPDFTGPVRDWGCLAHFDDNGNMVEAYTLKTKDFTSGKTYEIRKYSVAELDAARPQILHYKSSLGIKENFPIPVSSESTKLAVAGSFLNKNPSVTYALGRGDGDKKHELQVIKIEGSQINVVAADAMFATASDLAQAKLVPEHSGRASVSDMTLDTFSTAPTNASNSETHQAQSEKSILDGIIQEMPIDELARATTLNERATEFGRMGDIPGAIENWSYALKLLQSIPGTERDQAASLVNIGNALLRVGQYEAVVPTCEQALQVFQAIKGTEREQATCLLCIGAAFLSTGQYKAAISMQEQALQILRAVKGTELEQATCLNHIGVAASRLIRYEVAIAKQEQALKIYQTIKGTERAQAGCLVNIGGELLSMGSYEAALAKQEQALKIFRAIAGTGYEQATCLGNIGVVFDSMGQYEAGISKLEQALGIYETIKNTERHQANCLVNIGDGLLHLGQYKAAVSTLEQALKILQAVKWTKREQDRAWGRIGDAERLAGRTDEAIRAYVKARGNGWWISRGLGLAYHQRGHAGDPDSAVSALDAAVQLAEHERQRVRATEHRVGIFEDKTLVFADLVGVLADCTLAGTQTVLPYISKGLVTPSSPSAGLEAAFHCADRSKSRALEDALREKASLMGTDFNIKLLAEDRDLSLQISKLTSLREELLSTEVERKNKLIQQIDELQQRRNMIEVELKKTALGSYVVPEFRKPMEMAKELPAQTAVLQYSVGEKVSWLLILTSKGVTVHRVAAQTPALPELLPRQQATLGQLTEAWAKRSEKIGLEGLVQLARMRMEDLGQRPSARHNRIDATQEQAILTRLGELLVPASALSQLRQEKIHHLLVIPDEALHYIPFAVLRTKSATEMREQYLLEEFSVSYVPAMTTLETIRKQVQERRQKRRTPRHPLLAFANPSFREGIVSSPDEMVTRLRSIRGDYYDSSGLCLTALPETEQEALRVASLFGVPQRYAQPKPNSPTGRAVVCTGPAASEEVVKRWLGSSEEQAQWQYLLFSTHGLADTRNGMLSCLALSSPSSESGEDGFLQAQEILDLELDCDLVMLSACQTGLGRFRSGEGLVGLSGAFFYAGAESICASLWQVPTGPTSKLTSEFFRNLKEGKLDKAEALRRAQLAVLRSDQHSPDGAIRYSDPFCWAAFVLTGEWR